MAKKHLRRRCRRAGRLPERPRPGPALGGRPITPTLGVRLENGVFLWDANFRPEPDGGYALRWAY